MIHVVNDKYSIRKTVGGVRHKLIKVLPGRITMGGEDEGYCYAWRYGKSWRKVPGAIDWLKEKTCIKVIPKVGPTIPVPVGAVRNIKSAAEHIKYFYIRK